MNFKDLDEARIMYMELEDKFNIQGESVNVLNEKINNYEQSINDLNGTIENKEKLIQSLYRKTNVENLVDPNTHNNEPEEDEEVDIDELYSEFNI